MASRKGQPRIEKDEFGELTIPAGCYWGIGTARAVEYFAPTGRRNHAQLIDAIVQVKKAVAITNGELGLLNRKIWSSISQVCDEILAGQWREQFVVDAFGAGAGAALDINVNEVIANRACEILGDPLEAFVSVHPEKHVNLSQSTNDVYQTAMRVAALTAVKRLQAVTLELERLLRRKSLEFERIVKVGRTALRDATPVTLGQEFNCYGSTVERAERRISDATGGLEEVNLGGRVVGTGFNTSPDFSIMAVRNLVNVTNLALRPADDHFRLTQSMADFVSFSSSLKELAVDLAKLAADLRLLSSGPAAGLGEIKLPDLILQPAILLPDAMPRTSIAPMTEPLLMVCYQIIGNDHVVSLAAQAGQLDSNSLTPAIIDNILTSMSMLEKAIEEFNRFCLSKITADSTRCRELLDKSGALAAALASELGYQKALDLIKRAQSEGADVREWLIERKLLPREAIDRIFHFKYMTTPRLMNEGSGQEDTGDDTR